MADSVEMRAGGSEQGKGADKKRRRGEAAMAFDVEDARER